MVDFEFLEHTSDLKFRAYGETLDTVMVNAVKALTCAFIGKQEVDSKIKRNIKVSADSLEVLVHDFLSELIFLFATEQYVASDVSSLTVSEERGFCLKASLAGNRLDFSRHRVETEVKAVTYHDMVVREEKGGWVVQVVCDI